jgi:hypothetical protein
MKSTGIQYRKCVIGRNYVYYWILRGYKGREEAGDPVEGGAGLHLRSN